MHQTPAAVTACLAPSPAVCLGGTEGLTAVLVSHWMLLLLLP
jgi:hypothetical protein